MSNRRVGFVVVAGMLVGAGLLTGRTALADDAFQVTLTPSGGGAPVRASGDRLLPLLRDAVQSRGAFSSLQGKAFDGSVRYGEVPDAVHLTRDAAATTATMSSRLSGLQKSFAAANPAQLQKEVTGYVQSGANAYSDLLSAIDRNSVLGLIDGNPRAATAFMAEDAYFRWGLDPSGSWGDGRADKTGFEVRLDGGAGTIDADGLTGQYYTAALGFDWQIAPTVGLALSIPFEERELGGTSSYIGGGNLALPITILPLRGDGLGWRVAPLVSSWGAFSGDLAAGGFFVGGGVVSSLRLRQGPLDLTLANQATYNGGIPLSIGEINYETGVDQWVFKNGIEAAYLLNPKTRVDASITYSNFANPAAVPSFFTGSAGLDWRFGRGSGVRVGYRGDFADNYTSHGGVVSLYFLF